MLQITCFQMVWFTLNFSLNLMAILGLSHILIMFSHFNFNVATTNSKLYGLLGINDLLTVAKHKFASVFFIKIIQYVHILHL